MLYRTTLNGTSHKDSGGTLYRFDPSSDTVTFVHQFPAQPVTFATGRLRLGA